MDLWWLAAQGRANGVTLLPEGLSGERFATSTSEAGVIHRLTAYSCTCKGFTHHGRCQHHSLLLAELGWLPDPDDGPAPPAVVAIARDGHPVPAPAPCPSCGGSSEGAWVGSTRGGYRRPCIACGGRGQEVGPGARLGRSREPGTGPAGSVRPCPAAPGASLAA